MKINNTKTVLLAIAFAGLAALGQARADLASQYIWANGQSYGFFALDGGLGVSSITGGSVITGAVGLGPGFSSNGVPVTLNSDASSLLNGNVYYSPNSQFTGTQDFSGSFGKIQQSSALMSSQDNNAVAAGSTFANATLFPSAAHFTSSNTRVFSTTSANMSLTGNQTLTLTGSGQSVIRLNNFTISSSTLDLVGTSANTQFVFDISGLYSLNNAHIVLGANVTAGNVIFNLIGTSPASANPGSSGYYSLYNSTVTGSILAPNREIAILAGSSLTGIAVGEQVVVDDSTITQSPSSQ